MNSNTYLNLIGTLGLIGLITFGIVGISAVDHLRFKVEELHRAVRSVESRMNELPAASAVSPENTSSQSGVKSAPEKTRTESPGANVKFFDPKAEQGGRLVEAILSDTQNMNYLINNDSTVAEFWGKTMDSLAERNYENPDDFQPLLADSWTLSDDQMVYRIKLRKGVYWHDFTDPVTQKKWKNVEVKAQDFKFYVDVVKNEKVDAAAMRGYLMGIQEIRIINDSEFEVVWNQKYFLSKEITLSLMPLPRHLYHAYEGPFDGERFNNDHERNRIIVGCGPYRFVRWDKGNRIVFKRFEEYYGRRLGIMPPIETLVYDLIQHPNTRLQALISRELDLDGLNPDQWINRTSTPEFDEKTGFLRKIKYPALAYNYIGLNQKYPLFQDKTVRAALSYLIDRDRIIREVYHDLARPVTGPFFLDSPANDPSVKPYPFSVETAKKMLADAGWTDVDQDGILEKNGQKLKFTLIYPNVNTTYQKMLPLIKEDMAKAGVQMELLRLEWSVIVQRLGKKTYEACMLGWTANLTPDPYQLWHSSYADMPESSNHIAFKNPEADRLIEQIRVTFDPLRRNELYHQFHRLIYEEAPYIFLFSPYNLMVLNKRYQNLHVFPTEVPTRLLWEPKDLRLPAPGGI